MKKITPCIRFFVLCFCMVLTQFVPAFAAEIDDSAVFIEAFNAYQQKDFLLTVEKCDQLNEAFPDSPLRDVALLLAARANLKAGDNERAAKSAGLFLSEFPGSSLKSSVEDELKTLVERHKKGETLAADKTLRASARKVRAERAQAEQERLALIKQEEERLEKARLLAEQRAKESIKADIAWLDDGRTVRAGSTGAVPFEISSRAKESEEFLLTVSSAKEYDTSLVKAGAPHETVARVLLAPGETFKGQVNLRMPAGAVDGHRTVLTINAVSARFSDVSFRKEVIVTSSAPLVRAVAKLAKQKVAPGEKLRYRVTVLNVGSQPAEDLAVRLRLPQQLDLQNAPDTLFTREADGTMVFKVEQLGIGRLSEITLDVQVRKNSVPGQELRGQVEITNNTLHNKEIFTATASIVVP
ncbi:MAG: hypothetical protein PHY09_17885 [Desulfuromonadaceae bacterium]|nr:hypothetical protein [Desulfuromonadaceae bacterium]MDD5107345.1 hypothetical protein [Desulfuromonadaceae bacterium]